MKPRIEILFQIGYDFSSILFHWLSIADKDDKALNNRLTLQKDTRIDQYIWNVYVWKIVKEKDRLMEKVINGACQRSAMFSCSCGEI